MKLPSLLLLALIFSLAACGSLRESRLNPFNWFGGSRSQTNEVVEVDGRIDSRGRILVDQINSMRVNRTPGGAVIEVAALPPSQGFWDVELVAVNDGIQLDGVLAFEFRVAEPLGFQPEGTPVSREVVAATAVSAARLQNVSEIRVIGLRNFRSSRR